MFKSISAAMLAVSVLAAPVFAASADKTAAPAPVSKTTQAPADKTQAPVIKADQAKSKSKALNANARMGHKHYRHHRHHMKTGALKTHASPKLATKHVTPSAKRG